MFLKNPRAHDRMMHDRMMYDRIYTHFTENKVIFEKQFGFRAGRSTNHDV